MEYPRIMAFVRDQPWALQAATMAVFRDVLRFRANGGRLSDEEIQARVGAKAARSRERLYDPDADQFYEERWSEGESLGYRSQSGEALRPTAKVVSVIGVHGVIAQRAAQVDDISGPGGTSIERLTQRFRAALDDARVKGIVFDVDSPGGGVYGVQELADEIRAARGVKPIGAAANSLMASAAYWLGAQVDPGLLYVTPSGEAGSIGVYAAHEDVSKALEMEGIKVSLLSYGDNKVMGNPFEPLTEEARTTMLSRVEQYGRAFDAAVAKGRGVQVEKVRKDFGQGLVFGARAAISRGVADVEGTLDELVRKVGGRTGAAPSTTALGGPTPVELAEMDAARARSRVL